MVQAADAVLDHGLDAVEAACAEALTAGLASAAVVLTVLARQRQPAEPPSITTPDALRTSLMIGVGLYSCSSEESPASSARSSCDLASCNRRRTTAVLRLEAFHGAWASIIVSSTEKCSVDSKGFTCGSASTASRKLRLGSKLSEATWVDEVQVCRIEVADFLQFAPVQNCQLAAFEFN